MTTTIGAAAASVAEPSTQSAAATRAAAAPETQRPDAVTQRDSQPVKATDSKDSTKDALWHRLFHLFQFKREEFLAHYHKRSNVETVFSMVKAKFGNSVRSKTDTAQKKQLETVLARFGDPLPVSNGSVAVRLADGTEELADVVRRLDSEGIKVADLRWDLAHEFIVLQ